MGILEPSENSSSNANNINFKKHNSFLNLNAKENGKNVFVCVADLNGLKHLNDTYGHAAGDEAIRVVSGELTSAAPSGGKTVRIGGDEFISLAVTGSDCDVDSMKERIEKVTKRHNQIVGKPYPIEMSTGIYKFKIAGKVDIYDAMNNADRLLYDEKIRKKKGRQFNQ